MRTTRRTAVHHEVAGAGDLDPDRPRAGFDDEFTRFGARDLLDLVVFLEVGVLVGLAPSPLRHGVPGGQQWPLVLGAGAADPQCPRYPGDEVGTRRVFGGFRLVVRPERRHGHRPRRATDALARLVPRVLLVSGSAPAPGKIPTHGSLGLLSAVVPPATCAATRGVGFPLLRPQLDFEPRRPQCRRDERRRDGDFPHTSLSTALLLRSHACRNTRLPSTSAVIRARRNAVGVPGEGADMVVRSRTFRWRIRGIVCGGTARRQCQFETARHRCGDAAVARGSSADRVGSFLRRAGMPSELSCWRRTGRPRAVDSDTGRPGKPRAHRNARDPRTSR